MNAREKVTQVLRNVRSLPTLPTVVMQLLQHTESDAASVRAIAATVERDVALAARVLKLVNSPMFGIRREVTSVQQALLIVGLRQLRSIVLSSAVVDVFDYGGASGGINRQELWEHSVTTAVIARILAKRHAIADPEMAFTAGLIHDVGKIVLDRYLAVELAEVLLMIQETGITMIDAELRVLGVQHAQIGEHLALHWNLPDVLRTAIGCHHAPAEAEQNAEAAALIAVANHLAHERCGTRGSDRSETFRDALRECALSEPEVLQSIELSKDLLDSQCSAASL